MGREQVLTTETNMDTVLWQSQAFAVIEESTFMMDVGNVGIQHSRGML